MTRPAFRKPWEHGAKAYHEADTLAALAEGMKRKRRSEMVSMPFSAVGDLPCGVCGIPLQDPYPLNPGEPKMVQDKKAKVTYYPKSKGITAAHYYCGWGALLQQIVNLRDLVC